MLVGFARLAVDGFAAFGKTAHGKIKFNPIAQNVLRRCAAKIGAFSLFDKAQKLAIAIIEFHIRLAIVPKITVFFDKDRLVIGGDIGLVFDLVITIAILARDHAQIAKAAFNRCNIAGYIRSIGFACAIGHRAGDGLDQNIDIAWRIFGNDRIGLITAKNAIAILIDNRCFDHIGVVCLDLGGIIRQAKGHWRACDLCCQGRDYRCRCIGARNIQNPQNQIVAVRCQRNAFAVGYRAGNLGRIRLQDRTSRH